MWFSNTAGSVTVHILTSEPPTASDTATHFAVDVNNGCLLFEAIIPGANYDGKAKRRFAHLPRKSAAVPDPEEDGSLTGPQIDNTKEGLAYRIHQPPPSTVDEPPEAETEKPDKADKPNKENKGKKKGHAKHGCDHPGKGQGHDEDCPEEDD